MAVAEFDGSCIGRSAWMQPATRIPGACSSQADADQVSVGVTQKEADPVKQRSRILVRHTRCPSLLVWWVIPYHDRGLGTDVRGHCSLIVFPAGRAMLAVDGTNSPASLTGRAGTGDRVAAPTEVGITRRTPGWSSSSTRIFMFTLRQLYARAPVRQTIAFDRQLPRKHRPQPRRHVAGETFQAVRSFAPAACPAAPPR